MLKVLIIDDEPNVRRGLKTIINWEEYGYSVCGEAADGIEGEKKIEELDPDLILADINMPYVSGLELIEKLRVEGNKCKVIILSGYNDFAYAKKAIKFGVSSYLLKPIEEDELITIIKELKDVIIEEKGMKDIIVRGKRDIRNEMLRILVEGIAEESSIRSDIKEEISYLNYESYAIALQSVTNSSNNIKLNILNTFLAEEACTECFEYNGNIIILFKGADHKTEERVLKTLCNRVKKEYKYNIIAAVGRNVKSVSELKQSYEDAFEIMQNKFYYGNESIIFYEQISKREDEIKNRYIVDKLDLYQVADKFVVAIEAGDSERIRILMNEITFYFISYNVEDDRAKGYCSTLVLEIFRRLYDNHLSLEEQFNSKGLANMVYSIKNWPDLKDYLIETMNKVSRILLSTGSNSIIKRIKEYIDKNIDKDLKLETMAEIFGYSSAYLGKMFKSETGEYYNTYIDTVRIEHSKRLLLQGVRTIEVAKKTGFSNTDYFYSKFKKYMGMGPAEYKKLNRQYTSE